MTDAPTAPPRRMPSSSSTSLEQLQAHSSLTVLSADAQRLQGTPARDAACDLTAVVALLREPEQAARIARVARAHPGQPLDAIADLLVVRIGCDLLDAVPGHVCIDVDARLAFDAAASMARVQRLHALYRAEGVPPERLRFGLSACWEGIQAAKALSHHGIACSLGQVHGLCQAIACAEAGVAEVAACIGPAGAAGVAEIWRYFKKFGIETELLACGVGRAEEALALAGCDRLALSPELIAALSSTTATIACALDAAQARDCGAHAQTFHEASFRYALNEDAVASERLAGGLRAAAAAARELDALIEQSSGA